MASDKDRHVRERERTGHESFQSHWDLLEPLCSEGRFQMQPHKGSSASLGPLQGRTHLLPIADGKETQNIWFDWIGGLQKRQQGMEMSDVGQY